MSSRPCSPKPRRGIRCSESAEPNGKVNNDEHLDTSDDNYDGNSIEAEASDESCAKAPEDTKDRIERGCVTYLAGIVGAIVLAYWVFTMLTPSEKKCSYNELRQRHQKQDQKMWQSLSINIEHILNERSTKPAVYLFLHQGSRDMQALVKNIASDTVNCFGGGQLVEMSENDFTTDDYGYAIEKFKNKIKKGHVALIVHLNKIPVEAARALHFICDVHTPIAEGVVIYLTLVTPSSIGTPKENAVNTLRNLWSSKLEYNVLDPLITRVTDEVIALKSE
ncbi:uncharacterized protein LOC118738968 isoform X1 [Rhagoletis pomonella]|uniref:uncharacterized protein LOC118738968 isoform X1 n=1 Tax=Rhagoletis pomonella TaxID=28610 RepID=UPI001785744D|nr:uncharacterized protein LOC118738968 isoform X1 [Rhagoletis pomonella]